MNKWIYTLFVFFVPQFCRLRYIQLIKCKNCAAAINHPRRIKITRAQCIFLIAQKLSSSATNTRPCLPGINWNLTGTTVFRGLDSTDKMPSTAQAKTRINACLVSCYLVRSEVFTAAKTDRADWKNRRDKPACSGKNAQFLCFSWYDLESGLFQWNKFKIVCKN